MAAGALRAVAIDGALLPDPRCATVPISDRGLLLGDAVFETLRSWSGRLPFLPRHLRRLRASADALALALPSDEQLAAELHALLAAAGGGEKRLRLQVTRGDGPIGLDPGPGGGERRIALATELPASTGPRTAALVAAARSPAQLPAATVKTSSYAPSIAAQLRARALGADEALRVDEGCVLDAAAGNLFVVQEGALLTPPCDGRIRAGVTRELLLELAGRLGLPVREEALPAAQVGGWQEAFVCSSARGLAPIGVVLLGSIPPGVGGRPDGATEGSARTTQRAPALLHDAARLALPAPGPVTRALAAALEALARG